VSVALTKGVGVADGLTGIVGAARVADGLTAVVGAAAVPHPARTTTKRTTPSGFTED